MSRERLIKEDLGERLFASINKLYPTMAGRITGMLLEMNNSDLLYHNEPLKAKVEEAVLVLQVYDNNKGKNDERPKSNFTECEKLLMYGKELWGKLLILFLQICCRHIVTSSIIFLIYIVYTWLLF